MKRTERYEVVETVQKGMLATSYQARDRVLDRLVLLKVLHPRLVNDTELVQRFRREALLQARLRHPHIVTVYDFGGEDDFYIASEFVEGETLDARLGRARKLSFDELRPLLVQVVDALAFAHDHGVVHRDLKPANVMITTRGEAKLTDFGLAYAPDMGQLTQDGFILGTPAYMSPEQARGQETDVRTDVFSLGVVMYQALTGRNPFAAESPADAMSRVLHHRPEKVGRHTAGLAPQVADLVMRMLAKEREQRPAGMKEVERVLAGDGVTAGAGPRRRKVLAPVLVSVSGVAAVAVVLVLTLGNSMNGRREPAAVVGDAAIRAETALVARDSGSVAVERVADSAPESAPEPEPVRQPEPMVLERPVGASRLGVVVEPWAEVLVDGQMKGVTPLAGRIEVGQGRHTIELRNPFYPVLVREFTVQDTVLDLGFDLDREFALLEIVVVPWAVVEVNGEVVDTTPLDRAIPVVPGSHAIRLSHPQFGVREYQVEATTAGTYRLSYNMAQE